jgi:hypothetical protein
MADETPLIPVLIEVRMPTPEEIGRVIDAWFDAQPLSVSYGVFAGDDQGVGEMDPKEQLRVQQTALRYWWLQAARKRVARP